MFDRVLMKIFVVILCILCLYLFSTIHVCSHCCVYVKNVQYFGSLCIGGDVEANGGGCTVKNSYPSVYRT